MNKRGKFEVWRSKDRKWYFRLRAENHRIIAQSEGYSSRSKCLNGVEAVSRVALFAQVVEVEA